MKHRKTPRETITAAAEQWRGEEHGAREEAVAETVEAPNRWTEQALDHALDRWMQRLTPEALDRWIGEESVGEENATVAVLHGEEGPFSGLRAALAVWALGYEYVGVLSSASPALLPAFAEDVRQGGATSALQFAPLSEALNRADAAIVDRSDVPDDALEKAQIPGARRLVLPDTYSVGVIDGHETEDEMERLAEDILLFEGRGRRRLAILWAPKEHPPDAYLEAMARFRGLFPVHEETPGTLQMQQAFLEARDQPHAYAKGLEFLMSRGEPSPQKPGHVRWSEYEELEDVDAWLEQNAEAVYAVVARRHLHDQCPESWPLRTPGGVHIPPLDDEEGRAIVSFLRALSDDGR